jgi:anaerobic selenocysteine-containing dehydrogenase
MSHCGLVAEVNGEQIVRVDGDHDHPITGGYTCPKGRATHRIHHHPDAITRPLMRSNGALVPVSWDEALDDIAAKLRGIIDAYGPNAVGINFGSGLGLDSSGYAMEEALYHALGTPPKFSPLTIDGCAKVMIADAAAHGIADGQQVRVHNMRGAIVLTAKVDVGMRRGVASIAHGHEQANVNCLTSVDAVDPLGGMALYSGVPIALEPMAAQR